MASFTPSANMGTGLDWPVGGRQPTRLPSRHIVTVR